MRSRDDLEGMAGMLLRDEASAALVLGLAVAEIAREMPDVLRIAIHALDELDGLENGE